MKKIILIFLLLLSSCQNDATTKKNLPSTTTNEPQKNSVTNMEQSNENKDSDQQWKNPFESEADKWKNPFENGEQKTVIEVSSQQKNEGEITAQQKTTVTPIEKDAPRLGTKYALYAFDGTTDTLARNTTIAWFYNNWKLGELANYYQGSNYAGFDANGDQFQNMHNKAVGDICNKWIEKNIDAIFIVGFSRGAISAVNVANGAVAKCNAQVKWVGLIDAVSTGMSSAWSKTINDKSTICKHRTKPIRNENHSSIPYNTDIITNCTESVAKAGVTHSGSNGMGHDYETRKYLAESALAQGGAFKTNASFSLTSDSASTFPKTMEELRFERFLQTKISTYKIEGLECLETGSRENNSRYNYFCTSKELASELDISYSPTSNYPNKTCVSLKIANEQGNFLCTKKDSEISISFADQDMNNKICIEIMQESSTPSKFICY